MKKKLCWKCNTVITTDYIRKANKIIEDIGEKHWLSKMINKDNPEMAITVKRVYVKCSDEECIEHVCIAYI